MEPNDNESMHIQHARFQLIAESYVRQNHEPAIPVVLQGIIARFTNPIVQHYINPSAMDSSWTQFTSWYYVGQIQPHIFEAEILLCTIQSKHLNLYCQYFDHRKDKIVPRNIQSIHMFLSIDDALERKPLTVPRDRTPFKVIVQSEGGKVHSYKKGRRSIRAGLGITHIWKNDKVAEFRNKDKFSIYLYVVTE